MNIKDLGTERLEVETEPILWLDIVEPFAMRILRGCGVGLRLENKDKWGIMWLQQAESISQEEGEIPDKVEREEE